MSYIAIGVGIFGIILTASVLLYVMSVVSPAINTTTDQMENDLKPITSQVPQGNNLIQTGKQLDNVQSQVEDLNHVKEASNTGVLKSSWSFGTPLMIVIAAVAAILARLGFK